MTWIISLLCSGLCCLLFVVLFFALIGMMFLRKRGKKNVGAREAVQAGVELSRAFVRGEKTREQLLAEEDDDYNDKNKRR